MKLALSALVLVCGTVKAAADEPAISPKDIPKWGLYNRDYKSAPFIATAAKFQALDKEKAYTLLCELADGKKATKEELRDEGLTILCRMLFTAKPNGEFRRRSLGAPAFIGPTRFTDWPLEPIEIVDGVPFLVVRGYKGTGKGLPVRKYVDYCIENCDWNTYQFKPKSREEQQKALEKLLASPKLKVIDADDKAFLASQIDREDILLADFEGDTYPDGWKTTGTAFGKGPAKGTLPNQMAVSGFLGKGLVNSFAGGDTSTGTLTSPAFKIERKYLNFLIGGGKHAKTCVNLLVGGKVVRTASGPNDKPGGTERLDWHAWEVGEFEGKEAVIEIVDGETGGWGHINADHFVQSDVKKQNEPVSRTIAVEKQYLHLPVKTGAAMKRMKFVVGKETVREFDIELADGDKPDFWAFADVSAFKGKPLAIETVLVTGSKALDAIKAADDVPDAEKLYREKHRPLFHFTSRFGWLNDPNGLVYFDKEWHLFYQHNPFGVNWGNMHWGHAVSPDLVRWKELGIGLYPKKYGDMAFSGSAVVDTNNTSGWGSSESAPGEIVPVVPKAKPPLVLAYTSTGRGECIAYSIDKGRTWTEYDKNPVVKHSGRDPKLVWYEKGKHWVMAVYDEHDKKQWIAFHTSPDLKTWTFASRIEGFYECPDLFEMALGTDGAKKKWVLYAADGKYLLGEFDGKEFKPDTKEKQQLWHGRFYAAQTFENAAPHWNGNPRRVQIGWAQGVTFPGMPFNQQMTVPVDLHLYPANAKRPAHLAALPVEGVASLHDGDPVYSLHEKPAVSVPKPLILADNLDTFDMELEIEAGGKVGFTLDLRGTKLVYDPAKSTLTCKDVTVPVTIDDRVSLIFLRIVVDRGSVEVFLAGGRIAMSVAAIPDEKNRKLELIPQGGNVRIFPGAWVYKMKSAWEK